MIPAVKNDRSGLNGICRTKNGGLKLRERRLITALLDARTLL